ncbi:fungal specific transcription factor domain-containing protein [Colletotrichum truncatum]|uniref:Fungal specific transcription factor domain-containing protein n=1 Tax=Colletotrichum truncatum TaxID=5467 RepID=A0ACC3YY62_COLTU|nr:fungal specific transcription factor domain-containing protein [Colletotrichum truncatum]KAF6790838.1 fungal specific transcription factor domain-containing protein [Colletotrichum truncatum]
MTERLPLNPIPKTNTRRKTRVCTREACETCREKKAKCDGDNPCSRCSSRGLKCKYETRSYQTKRSLQVELEELKDAQRQRDAVLQALAAPGQTHDVLLRLWSGEPLERIYETISVTGFTSSPEKENHDETPDYSDQNYRELSSLSSRNSLTSPPILNYSVSGRLSHPEAGHIQGVLEEERFQPNLSAQQPESMIPVFSTPNYGGMAPTAHSDIVSPMEYSPPATFGMFLDSQNPPMGPSRQPAGNPVPTDDFGAASWWAQSDQNPAFSSFSSYSTSDSLPWLNTQNTVTPPSQASSTYTIPPATPSPTTISSSLSSSYSFPEMTPANVASSATENEFTMGTPPKKRKSTAGTSASTPIDIDAEENDANVLPRQSKSPSQQPPQNRERHRQASARNWQKQKQQTADLQAAKNEAEARNKELQRQYSEVLNEVMTVKNALMEHARCNHPAISSWLRSQATNYVLDGVNPDDKKSKTGMAGATRMVRSGDPVGCTGPACR